MNAAYWYDPLRPWIKALRFCSVIEDNLVRISITGVNSWMAAFNSLHAFGFTHDAVQMGGAIAHGTMALVFHTLKRGQMFANGRG